MYINWNFNLARYLLFIKYDLKKYQKTYICNYNNTYKKSTVGSAYNDIAMPYICLNWILCMYAVCQYYSEAW